MNTQTAFQKTADRVSLISIIANLLLSVFKFLAGILAHSGAMISDAVHSASDVFSTLIVMVGVRLSARESDSEHPYGHERLECGAAVILAAVLALTGLGIGRSAFETIRTGSYHEQPMPGILALTAAAVSILVKEGMYRYTILHAEKIHSDALKADAWHHRSDALSSIGALIGIGGARMGVSLLEPLASMVISLMIIYAAYEIFRDAMDKMVDKSCDEQTETALRNAVLKQSGVVRIDLLHTRQFGSRIYVDLEIAVDAGLSVTEAHAIAEQVHDELEKTYPEIKHIMIHVNPAA